MSVEFNKFKPGLRTNFNTDTGIKKNFAAKSAEGTSTSATRSTTGNTAAANLANKTLTSTNWSSQTGSVFNIKNSTQAANSGAVVNRNSSSGNSSYGVLNSSAKIKSSNYVSSGYGNNLYCGYDPEQRYKLLVW